MEPMLKAPGTERSKLKLEYLLTNFPFNFYLRRYATDSQGGPYLFAYTW
jgi:hypothetical protein